ncbi:hypothetical protein EVAR_3056_1 [Eumeta japonica]|uniref:Uncharacterized protein n=1 Tax=Eumeta variegata TaxID=151549 RepID=A0A4C1STL1_EUMVA|nr:hypothetical protein EVAR_3056_1 [Eumeta japonica]
MSSWLGSFVRRMKFLIVRARVRRAGRYRPTGGGRRAVRAHGRARRRARGPTPIRAALRRGQTGRVIAEPLRIFARLVLGSRRCQTYTRPPSQWVCIASFTSVEFQLRALSRSVGQPVDAARCKRGQFTTYIARQRQLAFVEFDVLVFDVKHLRALDWSKTKTSQNSGDAWFLPTPSAPCVVGSGVGDLWTCASASPIAPHQRNSRSCARRLWRRRCHR